MKIGRGKGGDERGDEWIERAGDGEKTGAGLIYRARYAGDD